MVLCSACDGVPLKFKKKMDKPLVHQHVKLDNTFKVFSYFLILILNLLN